MLPIIFFPHFYGTYYRELFFVIDSLLFSLVPEIYEMVAKLVDISNFIANEQAAIDAIAKSLYSLLAVLMLFRLAFSLLTMLADPEKIQNKEKGLSKIVVSVIITLALTVAVPSIFKIANDVQTKILENRVIENLFLHDVAVSCEDVATIKNDDKLYTYCGLRNNIGLYVTRSVLSLLIQPYNNSKDPIKEDDKVAKREEIEAAYESIITNPEKESKLRDLSKLSSYLGATGRTDSGRKVYLLTYVPIVSTIVGIYLIWVFITLCIDIGYRSLKLFTLKLIAPIAIISYVDPESASKGIFKKWTEECVKTYLSLFIRIASLSIASLIMYIIDWEKGNFLVNIFFFLGILTLIKTLPKIFENIFGIKPKSKEESFGQNLLRGALGATTSGVVGGLSGGISAKKHNYSFWGGFGTGAKTGLFSGATSAYNGKASDYFKSLGSGVSAVTKKYGYLDGAQTRVEKQKNATAKNEYLKYKNGTDAIKNSTNFDSFLSKTPSPRYGGISEQDYYNSLTDAKERDEFKDYISDREFNNETFGEKFANVKNNKTLAKFMLKKNQKDGNRITDELGSLEKDITSIKKYNEMSQKSAQINSSIISVNSSYDALESKRKEIDSKLNPSEIGVEPMSDEQKANLTSEKTQIEFDMSNIKAEITKLHQIKNENDINIATAVALDSRLADPDYVTKTTEKYERLYENKLKNSNERIDLEEKLEKASKAEEAALKNIENQNDAVKDELIKKGKGLLS